MTLHDRAFLRMAEEEVQQQKYGEIRDQLVKAIVRAENDIMSCEEERLDGLVKYYKGQRDAFEYILTNIEEKLS